jgi:alpha-glucosidase
MTWWRDAVTYQVYPRSYADFDGDGVGDLPGLLGRLDHLVDLGVDALWLSPFYRSPQVDAGYDVSDYLDVDPLFGRLSDVDALAAAAHERGLRLVVDLVPNHTSDRHAWFQEALAAGPGSAARERYMFRDGRGPGGDEPPNNWTSTFGGPAWTRVPDGQWYLHLFDPHQPDLNWDSPVVRAEFAKILEFWLDRGVDGFRVDVAHGLVKAAGLPDWPPLASAPPNVLDPAAATPADTRTETASLLEPAHAPMWDQDGVHAIYRSWREIVDGYQGGRILVAEAWVSPQERLARYVRPDEMHHAFNFDFLTAPWLPGQLRAVIDRTIAACGAVGAVATWVLSNHDVVRHTTRLAYPDAVMARSGIGPGDPEPDVAMGLRRGRAATLLMLALPGAAYLYQGEELGLPEDTWLPDDARQDPVWRRTGHRARGRDGCRVPLPWHADAPSYGFGPGPDSWLPQPEIWSRYALSTQVGIAASTYEMYRAALALRRQLRVGRSTLEWLDIGGAEALAFRVGELTVLTNLGQAPVPVPAGLTPVLVSASLEAGHLLATDTTAWLRVPA